LIVESLRRAYKEKMFFNFESLKVPRKPPTQLRSETRFDFNEAMPSITAFVDDLISSLDFRFPRDNVTETFLMNAFLDPKACAVSMYQKYLKAKTIMIQFPIFPEELKALGKDLVQSAALSIAKCLYPQTSREEKVTLDDNVSPSSGSFFDFMDELDDGIKKEIETHSTAAVHTLDLKTCYDDEVNHKKLKDIVRKEMELYAEYRKLYCKGELQSKIGKAHSTQKFPSCSRVVILWTRRRNLTRLILPN